MALWVGSSLREGANSDDLEDWGDIPAPDKAPEGDDPYGLTKLEEITVERMTKINQFCVENRVEVLVQEDGLYHCYVNYKEGAGSWSCAFNGFAAIIEGVENYMKHNPKP